MDAGRHVFKAGKRISQHLETLSRGERVTGASAMSRWVDPDTNRRLWRMSGPMILANVAVPLRGAVDTAMVGHLAEPYFLVAVATGTTIFNFIFFAFNCLRMGTTAPTAQAVGAGDVEVRAILWRALLLSALISTSLLALQLPIVDVALWMIPASAEAEAHARTFFLIRIWAMPAALATYAFVGWLYGLEDARMPLVLQIVTNLINIALDFLFVFGFEWGVAGVAAAGLIADSGRLQLRSSRHFAPAQTFRRRDDMGAGGGWCADAANAGHQPRYFHADLLRCLDVGDFHRPQRRTWRP